MIFIFNEFIKYKNTIIMMDNSIHHETLNNNFSKRLILYDKIFNTKK
jgi:hypothetical protein